MNILSAEALEVSYDDTVVLKGLYLRFERPEIVSLIGSNGSGKSTILKSIGRLLRPGKGTVLLNGRDIHSLPAAQVARMLSVLPQGPQAPDDLTVRDLVSYGRTPHRRIFGKGDEDDEAVIRWALRETSMESLAGRQVHTLSGGERQRAWIAMALAQKTELLLLDEPTTFLDIHHQFEIMELLQRLNRKYRIMVIMVLHDLNHAARFSHRVIAVKGGCVVRDGSPGEVITEETLGEVFGIRARILSVGDSACAGSIVCIPYGVCR
ncbi:MAG: ABC transporter ATP-binding protein [Alphaproteobacteria bacterium]|uniref:ABC transporter ATP-binding protein n=1 Tax=Candidatus Nitrobium versatile TaxID=2884831 RepID=A0A953SCX2_9BACT|nr:ABC transporter ATP-binding protein [Candidatus Nitrobium versatile]